MNGPIRMYRTKQIVRHDFPVELPKCMYALKNIHSKRNGMVDVDGSSDHVAAPERKVNIFDQNNQQIPGMAELEAKQEDILKQLADLKKQILSIKSDLNISSTSCAISGSTNSPKFQKNFKVEGPLPEIIINASPKNLPYSLQLLQRLLQDTISLNISSHLHSSVSSLAEDASLLEHTLVNFKHKENVPKADIRLIWKNVDPNVELLVSHSPITGEVNMIRYLTRAISSTLSYDTAEDCIEIDSLLDLCYLLKKAKNKTERSTLLQTLNKSLGKSQWFLGRSCASVVDIAAYSAIKQVTSSNEVNVSMGKWLSRCEALATS